MERASPPEVTAEYWSNFWKERWQKDETGFHQKEINKSLVRWWKNLQLEARAHVFVPLCGKSSDMLWLLEQGHKVLGIELSEKAVMEFFTENDLEYEIVEPRHDGGVFKTYRHSNLTLLCGDFFSLTRADLATISAVYDRASLIALPPDIRQQYSDHLKKILPSNVQTLLVTLEYNQPEMSGPPFSVCEEELVKLYGNKFQVEKLCEEEILEANERFKERGLTSLKESVYRFS